MRKTLILDSFYICYRAMFTLGDFSYEDKNTGVIFGFLNQMLQLATKFDYPQFIFAWDSKNSYRRLEYPDYKKKDREPTEEMKELLEIAKPQFDVVRLVVLPLIGFNNSFIQTGLEADDIIAIIVQDLYGKEVFIVSDDNDLYQLLLPTHSLYSLRNKSIYAFEDFQNEYGILPSDWPIVKALAGCTSDNVKGIKGIGIDTAVKYLKGGITKGKKYQLILDGEDKMLRTNLPLIKLPYKRTKPVKLIEDKPDFKEFERMCLDYGFNSFLKKGNYEKWKKILS